MNIIVHITQASWYTVFFNYIYTFFNCCVFVVVCRTPIGKVPFLDTLHQFVCTKIHQQLRRMYLFYVRDIRVSKYTYIYKSLHGTIYMLTILYAIIFFSSDNEIRMVSYTSGKVHTPTVLSLG